MYKIKSKNEYTVDVVKGNDNRDMYFFTSYKNSLKFVKGEKVKDFTNKDVQLDKSDKVLYFFVNYDIIRTATLGKCNDTEEEFDVETEIWNIHQTGHSHDRDSFNSELALLEWLNNNIQGYDNGYYLTSTRNRKGGITKIIGIRKYFDLSKLV